MKIGNNLQQYTKFGIIMLGFAIAGSISVMLMNAAMAQSDSPDSQPASDERLISLYDRGVERTILTKAQTVREALKAAQVEIAEGQDVVEPGLDQELVATKYNINIYRARPVTIIDGAKRLRVTTAYQTPKQISEAAEVKLYPEDIIKTSNGGDLLINGADTVIEIDRATPVQFILYGKQTEVRTHAKTVGEMLKEKNIKLGQNDTLSVSENTPIASGMSVELWRDGKQTVTVDEEVDFEVEKIQDANREVGYREVKEAGAKGKRSVTYEIEMKNGQEVSRKEIASVTTAEPKKQVEAIGAKPKQIAGTCGEWMAAAGVPSSSSAVYLIGQESGCNPNAVNSSSGACGIGQALPCSKMGAVNADGTSAVSPTGQLQWMQNYVIGHYGSWEAAAAHHNSYGWY